MLRNRNKQFNRSFALLHIRKWIISQSDGYKYLVFSGLKSFKSAVLCTALVLAYFVQTDWKRWGRGHLFSAHGSGSRISAELRSRAHYCRSFFVLHCSWCSQLRHTAQARSSAAALRLVPYRAISSHFSPAQPQQTTRQRLSFTHSYAQMQIATMQNRAWRDVEAINRDGNSLLNVTELKKNHGVVAGLWPTEFRWAFMQSSDLSRC